MNRPFETPLSSRSFLRHHGLEPLPPHVADFDVEQAPPLAQPTSFEPPFLEEPPLGVAEPLVPADALLDDEPMSEQEAELFDRRQFRARTLGVIGILIALALAAGTLGKAAYERLAPLVRPSLSGTP